MDATPEGSKVKSDYDISELDISFDKISKQATSTGAAVPLTGKEGETGAEQAVPEVSKLSEE
jgi:hypothetical protein